MNHWLVMLHQNVCAALGVDSVLELSDYPVDTPRCYRTKRNKIQRLLRFYSREDIAAALMVITTELGDPELASASSILYDLTSQQPQFMGEEYVTDLRSLVNEITFIAIGRHWM